MNEPVFHADVLEKLVAAYGDDPEVLEMIGDCIRDFSAYHAAIVEMETWLKLYNYDNTDRTTYQDKKVSLDKARTVCHNAVLGRVNVLNRMAAQTGLEPVYDGTVSEERPYRRQVANAVLAYLEDVIRNRM